MEIDYEAIGRRVRVARRKKNLTQQTLAEQAGLEPSNISHIERGKTKLSLPTLVHIANALEVPAEDLLCDSLVRAETSYHRAIAEILSDCNARELRALTDVMLTTKSVLRKFEERTES